MRASVVIIGDEILLGQVTDTNSGEIARALCPDGWQMASVAVVPDSLDDICDAMRRALSVSDLVITTGGLGPTKDDVTKQALLRVFGGELQEDAATLANVERVFEKRGLRLNDSTRSQAMVPTSCRVIQNELGTAPIMWFEREGKVLVSMPGVPFETVGMLHRQVKRQIAERFAPSEMYMHFSVVTTGITESDLSERLEAFEGELPAAMRLAYLPVPGYVRLRLDCACGKDDEQTQVEFGRYSDALKAAVSEWMVSDRDASPAEIALERLRGRGWTLATAESCTGGYIAHKITSVAGCSDCYKGGVVSYSNEAKASLLGVDAADIDRLGAVSEEVARQMAEGACKALGADCAVSTTGIAGPGGAVPGKPVGTVWIAAHTPAGTVSRLLHLPGSRSRVIDRAATEALLLLIRNS